MKRKTYNNVLKAAKLIQKKGYEQKEALEIAVQKFDELEKAAYRIFELLDEVI